MDCPAFLLAWRRWIRFVVVVTYIVLLVIAVPLCIWELGRNGAPDHVQVWFVGGIFVLLALPISFWGILQHIINYTTPHLQRYIIRILWMVPIYALNAWFALRFPNAAIYLDTLRECYEAYVVYNFMAYLLSFLNHDYPHLDIQIENKPPVRHLCPLCLLPPCQYSLKFIQRCKHGVLQYTMVRPAMTIIALICEMFDIYNEGDFNFKSAWSYIVIINNLSQILAMYCLILFYKAFMEELRPLKPIPKLLCVKFVVFLSFWQSLLIAALAKAGVIPEQSSVFYYKDVKAVSTGIQDFLICIEMFVAAIAHYFSFSHKPFVNLAADQQNCCASFLSMWNVRDVTEDMFEHARYIGQGVHRTLSRGKRLVRGEDSERTPLLANGGSVQQALFQDSQDGSPSLMVRNLNEEDALSSGGDSLFGPHIETFVNKSTTSSMVNYADFQSDTSWQQESKSNRSGSTSLKGFDTSGDELDRDRYYLQKLADETSKISAIVDTGASKPNERRADQHFGYHKDERLHNFKVDDDTFYHLDVHEDERFQIVDGERDKTIQSSDAHASVHPLDILGNETLLNFDIPGDEGIYSVNLHDKVTVPHLDAPLEDQVTDPIYSHSFSERPVGGMPDTSLEPFPGKVSEHYENLLDESNIPEKIAEGMQDSRITSQEDIIQASGHSSKTDSSEEDISHNVDQNNPVV